MRERSCSLFGIEVAHKCVVSLNEDKSLRPNELHIRILRELEDVISEPLSIISKNSWEMAEVSKDWR